MYIIRKCCFTRHIPWL